MILNYDKVGFKYRRLITKVFDKALKETGNDEMNVIITVSFVDEKRIQELNKISRNVDKITDVLSFPMLDIKYPQKVKDFKDEIIPDGTLYLGDIVICKKRAKQQAKDYKHSLKREIGFLALHGLLHILGYDHIEKEDEVVMFKTAKDILDSLGLKRGQNV